MIWSESATSTSGCGRRMAMAAMTPRARPSGMRPETIVVVAHAGVISAGVSMLLREELYQPASYQVGNCSLTQLTWDEPEGVPTVVCLLQTADEAQQPPRLRQQWLPANVVELLTPLDDTAATQTLVKAIRAMKTIDDLALARHLPAFRESVARGLSANVVLVAAS